MDKLHLFNLKIITLLEQEQKNKSEIFSIPLHAEVPQKVKSLLISQGKLPSD